MNKFTFMAQASKSMGANISEVDASVIIELVKARYLTKEELVNKCELLPFLIDNSLENLINAQMVEKSHDKYTTTCIGDELIEIAATYHARHINPDIDKKKEHKNTNKVTTEHEVLKELAKELIEKRGYTISYINLERGNYTLKIKENPRKINLIQVRSKGFLRIRGFNFNEDLKDMLVSKGMELIIGAKRGNYYEMWLDIKLTKENVMNVLSEI